MMGISLSRLPSLGALRAFVVAARHLSFAKAAADLAPCLLVPTPANLIPFLRDILCLILKLLHCFLNHKAAPDDCTFKFCRVRWWLGDKVAHRHSRNAMICYWYESAS